MKHLLKMIFGIVLLLAGLWGGSWLVEAFRYGSPYSFAAVMTMLFVMVVGTLIAMDGYVDMMRDRP